MLKRKITDRLLEWKNTKDKECLLVKGARQIGKTFIIEDFARKNYKHFVEINFEQHPEMIPFSRPAPAVASLNTEAGG